MDREKTSVASLFYIYLLYISFLFIFYGLAQKTAKPLHYQGVSHFKKVCSDVQFGEFMMYNLGKKTSF